MSGKKLPFEDNTVYLFYSSHTLEHLPDEAVEHVLKEGHRCLKEGGGIRLVVPDIDLAYLAYANRNVNFFDPLSPREDKSLEEKFLNYFATPLKDKVDIKEVRYNFEKMEKYKFLNFYTKQIEKQIDTTTQHKNPGDHINWFDYPKLKKMLEEAGFQKIYKSTAQGSEFNEMQGKEFDTRPLSSLQVEAIK